MLIGELSLRDWAVLCPEEIVGMLVDAYVIKVAFSKEGLAVEDITRKVQFESA